MSGYVWRDPKRWRAIPGCLSGPECGLCMTRIRQTTPISPAEWKLIDAREAKMDRALASVPSVPGRPRPVPGWRSTGLRSA